MATFSGDYRMSFSTGGLFLNESVAVAGLRADAAHWDDAIEAALARGVLPFRKASSAKRSLREITNRLERLSEEERQLLMSGERHERAALLWLAACRAYRFVAEFTVEVVADRSLSMRTDLGYADFDQFLESKTEWHPELGSLRPSTRGKLRQVLFRMMREADLLTPDHRILDVALTPRLLDLILASDARELRFFPGAQRLSKARY